jgi:hypothetical protein
MLAPAAELIRPKAGQNYYVTAWDKNIVPDIMAKKW